MNNVISPAVRNNYYVKMRLRIKRRFSKYIDIRLRHGLANRLCTLVTAGVVAKDANKTLRVNWEENRLCNIKIGELISGRFMEGSGFADFDDDATFNVKYFTNNKTMFFGDDKNRMFEKRNLAPRELHNLAFFSGAVDEAAIRFSEGLNELQFCGAVLDRLMSIPEDTIGLHVRTHDFGIPVPQIIDEFKRYIDGVLEYNSETRFFLATDTESAYRTLVNEYSGIVVGYPFQRFEPERASRPGRWRISPSRMSGQGVIEAAMDLLTLSSASKIVRTQGSSFSWLASMWNLVPIETIRIDKYMK